MAAGHEHRVWVSGLRYGVQGLLSEP